LLIEEIMLAYFDCFCGISGDMTLGALVDLGVPLPWLKDNLGRIPLADFDLAERTVQRNGIHARMVTVKVDDQSGERNFSEIKALILGSPLSDQVKSRSIAIFQRLAAVEARIHGCPIEEVHFHEVGGIDAIADIVGTCLCLEYLGISEVLASTIPLGRGFVTCRHGTLPVPAPATAAILADVPVYGTDIEHELVTPTGAAIIVSLAQSFGSIPQMVIRDIGYGAGQRELKSRPNLLRIIRGEKNDHNVQMQDHLAEDRVIIVETCIDDMNPEMFGFLMDRLFEDGALDVYWVPIYMKKNRPATMVQVLCPPRHRDTIVHRILSETTSTGTRFHEASRRMLFRDHCEIDTSFGTIAVKRIKDTSGHFRIVPEYEVCKNIAIQRDIPLQHVYETIMREAANLDLNGID
jgi:uncharacterized protein (TIGR00299 family) protein